MAAQYGDFHYKKINVKESGKIAARGKHNERTRETPNADPDRLCENVRLAGSGDWLADVRARADEATFTRANSVLALDITVYVSRGFFDDKTSAVLDEWARRTMAWMAREFGGEKNVVAAILHKDETTPHIQAMIVPLDERDRLNARAFIGQPSQVSALHTSYHEAVADLGLQRGVQGSRATYQELQDYYAKVRAPTPAPEIVRRDLEVERPGRLISNPERWANEQTERIAERVTPAVDAALTKANHYEEQAAKAEANVAVLQQRVREVERERDTLQRDYTALVAQVRQLDLRDTMQTLGGVQDRYDTHKWQVNGEHISINGEKFYNHDRQSGGGQSIDLVMHVAGYTFRQAVAFLNHEAGPELAIAASAQHGARQGQEIVERGARAVHAAGAG